MAFSTDNALDTMMALNSFHPQFDPQSIPSYVDWVANTTFDPFGPEPFAVTSHPIPETHLQTQVDMSGRVHLGYGSSEDGMTRDFPQEVSPDPLSEDRGLDANSIYQRSRFAFAQKRIGRPTDVSAGQVPAAHVLHPSPGRSRSPSPLPIRTTHARALQVAGPRPTGFERSLRTKREATLAVPKPVYPLPMWLTHFEDYEQELLADFCPPSQDSSPSTSTFPLMIRVRLPSEHASDCSPLDVVPLLGFVNTGYADAEAGGWYSEEDEDSDEDEDRDYHPSESGSDLESDFGSDYVPFGSESSAPASYRAGAIDWSAPFQGQVGREDGYSRASAVTTLQLPSLYSPSPPPSSPHIPSVSPFDLAAQLPNFLPWSILTNPFTRAPSATTSPGPSSTAPVAAYNPAGAHVTEVDADRFLTDVEEGLGFGSGSGSLPEPIEAGADGWHDRFELTGPTFLVPPRSPLVVAGFEAPPLVYTGTIPLPDMEEGGDAELDAVVVPKSPWYWWW